MNDHDFYTTVIPKPDRFDTRKRLALEHRCYVWTTQAGHLIPVTQMRDSHLTNAYVYTCQQWQRYHDHPQALSLLDISERFSRYAVRLYHLEHEIKRRGLVMPAVDVDLAQLYEDWDTTEDNLDMLTWW